jgi:hypothetical protein
VGVVLVHDKHAGPRDVFVERAWGGEELPDTLLGFETTGPSPLRPDGGKPGVVVTRVLGRLPVREWVVVALLWWWGVVFDLWIVVASIWRAWWSPPLWGWWFSVCVDVQFQSFV